VQVVIVEDSVVFGSALQRLLQDADIRVTAILRSADNALSSIAADTPDATILDIRMPPTFSDEGIRLAEQLRQLYPKLGILIFSTYGEVEFALRLLANVGGGFGYLTKDGLDSVETLRESLFRIVAGETVIAPEIVQRLLQEKGRRTELILTDRERSVLSMVAQGYSNAGIAEALHLSKKTVEAHLLGIFSKLGLTNRNDVNRRVLAVLEFLRSNEGRSSPTVT
jgi:DNA-binding NarL/FixJ family response regulator